MLEETFGVTVISRIFLNKEGRLKIRTLNERVEEEADTRADILHLLVQGSFIFIREKSGNFEKGCLLQPFS